MSEHTPLTEAEENVVEFVRTFETGEAAANALPIMFRAMNAARTSTATADTGLRERVEAASRVFGWQHLVKYAGQSDEWMDRTLMAVVRAALDATAAPTTDTGARDE